MFRRRLLTKLGRLSIHSLGPAVERFCFDRVAHTPPPAFGPAPPRTPARHAHEIVRAWNPPRCLGECATRFDPGCSVRKCPAATVIRHCCSFVATLVLP